jgi:hypothetical protein
MAILKVLGPAALLGILFALSGMAILEGLERSVGKGASVVILFLGIAGGIIGAIAGATLAVVDAIKEKHPG